MVIGELGEYPVLAVEVKGVIDYMEIPALVVDLSKQVLLNVVGEIPDLLGESLAAMIDELENHLAPTDWQRSPYAAPSFGPH